MLLLLSVCCLAVLLPPRCLIAAPPSSPSFLSLTSLPSSLHFIFTSFPLTAKSVCGEIAPACVEMKVMGITENAHKNRQIYLQDTLSGYDIVITAH